ncbi:hypothetical protein [Paenibacillus sp. N3.4]|uniref:hypothetical protein n=1 Tax=Paenibacillus sp. N3.4 TaxID=2603222 RepID=UPI0011C9B4ED|nr:hypothetical protein [Paenibacillus sp. N3.4]TXK76112.1 hypothetical protein FU659_26310 [Paenibacillus sp. N3.4]
MFDWLLLWILKQATVAYCSLAPGMEGYVENERDLWSYLSGETILAGIRTSNLLMYLLDKNGE